jgi:type I restriction enzyme S subunit
VLKGEYLINPINLNYDLISLRTAISGIDVCVSPAYIVLRQNHKKVDPTFGSYLLHVFDVRHMKTLGAGVRQTITFKDIGGCVWPLPPKPEQQAIASFLDHETARIDALIGKKMRFSELLKEKRATVITHAVTKGLDLSAPVKDSEVHWLRPVPAHWCVGMLKRFVIFQRGHDLPAEKRKNGPFPIVSSGGYLGHHSVAMARAPGIVTGRYGSIGDFTLVEEDYWPLNTALYSVNLFNNNPRYIWYMLHTMSGIFVMFSKKSAVPGIDRNDIHEIITAVPPLPEQDRIVEQLDSFCAKIDLVKQKTDLSISLLREKRAALITAAVTGKIDVRAAA